MARGQSFTLHDADPSRSVEQYFEKLFTSRDPSLQRLAAVAKGRVIPQREVDTDDGDDPDGADDPDYDMGDDSDGPELGPPRGPGGGAGSQSKGRSSADYELSGVNTSTNSPMADTTSNPGSYDPSRRSPSYAPPAITDDKSRRFVGDENLNRTQKRMRKLQRYNPDATSKELVHYATATKAVRKDIIRKFRRQAGKDAA